GASRSGLERHGSPFRRSGVGLAERHEGGASMTTVESHEPGKFCWVELATSDLDAGRKFYEGIFGWRSDARPVEGWGEYATFTVADGRGAAGGYAQQEAERSMGVPPHWNLYVFSDDVDKDVARATELGGQATIPG